MNYKLIATEVGELIKYESTVNGINRIAKALFSFNIEGFPNEAITSSRAQIVYNCLLSLEKQRMNDEERKQLLVTFCRRITPESLQGSLKQILEDSLGLSFTTDTQGKGESGGEYFAVHESQKVENSSKVFVVHGRNETARRAIFDFLRAIALRPLEWSQAIELTQKPTPYVGEILDAAFSHAQAVVVLFTGDDEAQLRKNLRKSSDPAYESRPTPQARPNVLFKAGIALGRYPERTVLVELGTLRPFSDVAGRHTIQMDNSMKCRQDLASRLRIAGCSVDMSGHDWHSVGNFSSAILTDTVEGASETFLSRNETLCPNCSTSGKPHLMSPIPKDFISIENATHECPQCKYKTKAF